MKNKNPKFFDDVKKIKLYDPLSQFLGSSENGIVSFKYSQIVKMAGHSCPTVAGAYLITDKALKALYGDDYPVRGQIKVEFKESIEDGVAGVIGNVISAITGATDINGFKGLGNQFSRIGLMKYTSNIPSNARFTRTDSGQSVDVYYDPSSVEANPKMNMLMQKSLSGNANEEEQNEFKKLWQDRVKRILIDNNNNLDVIRVESL